MASKRILILVENLPVPFDRRVWMEATTLAEAGYQVSVICPKGKYPKYFETYENIRIYRYPLPSLESLLGHFLEYVIALPMTLILTLVVNFKDGIDVIQSANPPDLFFVIGRILKIFGKKYIFDHHDLMPEMCDSRWSGWKHKVSHSLCIFAEKETFKTADRVIAPNESHRQVAINRGGINPEHVYIVRSGPSKKNFNLVPVNNSLKKGKKYLVCYLGVMGACDGLDYLLDAIDIVVHKFQHTDIQFTLIGSGDLLPSLKMRCTQLKLVDFIEFTGRIPDQQVKEIISTAELCVAPDPKNASNDLSTMNKIIEYMALGKPTVSFDLKESRVSAGDAAVYALSNDVNDFAGKIIDLLAQPERRKEMGSYARERFEQVLAWDNQKGNLLKLYDELF